MASSVIDNNRSFEGGGEFAESGGEQDFVRGGIGSATSELPESDSLAGKAKEAACFVGQKVEKAVEALGAGMETVGCSIREHAPGHGVLGDAGKAVGDKLESGGHYLEQHGLKGVGDDITLMIRRNPIPALLVGVGLGVLAAHLLRRQS